MQNYRIATCDELSIYLPCPAARAGTGVGTITRADTCLQVRGAGPGLRESLCRSARRHSAILHPPPPPPPGRASAARPRGPPGSRRSGAPRRGLRGGPPGRAGPGWKGPPQDTSRRCPRGWEFRRCTPWLIWPAHFLSGAVCPRWQPSARHVAVEHGRRAPGRGMMAAAVGRLGCLNAPKLLHATAERQVVSRQAQGPRRALPAGYVYATSACAVARGFGSVWKRDREAGHYMHGRRAAWKG